MTNSLLAKLTAFLLLTSPAANTDVCYKDCLFTQDGVEALTGFEGYSPVMYKDSAGFDTIGIGHLVKSGERFNIPMMPADAAALLQKDIKPALGAVNKYTDVDLHYHQADALTSFTFNVGSGTFKKSSVLRDVNDENHEDVPADLRKYNRAGGKVVKGLVNRREMEAKMYEGN